jgi:hypothetical protein
MVEHRQLRSRQMAGRLFSERKAKAAFISYLRFLRDLT